MKLAPTANHPGRFAPAPISNVCQRHGDDLVGDPIDVPERVDQGGPGRREVSGSGMVG